MTRVIERRQAAAPGETVLELRFFRTEKNAEVRAYRLPQSRLLGLGLHGRGGDISLITAKLLPTGPRAHADWRRERHSHRKVVRA
jgi:hypothetical protein